MFFITWNIECGLINAAISSKMTQKWDDESKFRKKLNRRMKKPIFKIGQPKPQNIYI